jgi:hypothetical protein
MAGREQRARTKKTETRWVRCLQGVHADKSGGELTNSLTRKRDGAC